MRTETDQLSGLNFSDLKSSTIIEQELPVWAEVNVLLATADGRIPQTVKAMQWRITSWPLAPMETPKKTWKHLIERLRRGGLA